MHLMNSSNANSNSASRPIYSNPGKPVFHSNPSPASHHTTIAALNTNLHPHNISLSPHPYTFTSLLNPDMDWVGRHEGQSGG